MQCPCLPPETPEMTRVHTSSVAVAVVAVAVAMAVLSVPANATTKSPDGKWSWSDVVSEGPAATARWAGARHTDTCGLEACARFL